MILCTLPGCQTTAGCQCSKWFDAFSERLTREYKAAQVRLYRPEEVERLVAAAEARGAERMREKAARTVEAQPFYPDTHTGARQQWVKDQAAAAIRALPAARAHLDAGGGR